MDKKALSYKKLAGDGKEIEGGKMAHSLRSLGYVRYTTAGQAILEFRTNSSAALNFAHVASGQVSIE